MLSMKHFLSFLQTISITFLKPRTNNQVLTLKAMPVLETALRLRYATKGAQQQSKLTMEMTNKIMALYFIHTINENLDSKWTQSNRRAFMHLPYHLCIANAYVDLKFILTDLTFLGMKCDEGLAALLMNDYDLHETSKSRLKLKEFFGLDKKQGSDNKKPTMQFSKRFNDYKLFKMADN